MAAPGIIIAVDGLDELRRDLRRVDKVFFDRAFKTAGREVAEPIAARVRSVLPRRSGRLAGTVRVATIRTGAALRVGSKRVPYVGPVEFGGYPRPARNLRWRGGLWRTRAGVVAWVGGGRPFIATGRYIFPTAAAMTDQTAAHYETALQHQINAYPWTHTKGT